MSNNLRLQKSLKGLDTLKVDRPNTYPGILGCTTLGGNQVEVNNRPGYVWVRLRSNNSEIIQAFNPSVSPIFDLPVIVSRDTNDPTRYVIVGRDSTGYLNWGVSAYLPRHSSAHEFPVDSDAGNDIVWVRGNQFTPLLVTPSGSSGAMAVTIQPGTYYMNGWHYVPQSGISVNAYKPTGTSATVVMVYADGGGNIAISQGSNFTATITGTAQVLGYLPTVTGTMLPLAAIRLLSGTSFVNWANIYDLREHIATPWMNWGTGTSGGASHNPVTLDANADTILGLSVQELGLDTQTQNFVWAGPPTGTSKAIPTFRALVDADIPISISRTGTSHAPVTLDVNADTVLSLSGQALGLDTETANYVWAGPTSGGVAIPSFRALVDADIPATIARTGTSGGTHNLLSATHPDTFATGVSRGAIVYGDSTPKWSALAPGATGTYLASTGLDLVWSSISTASSQEYLLIADDPGEVSRKVDHSIGTGTYGYLSGTINGSNTIFLVSNASFVSGTLLVWMNGQLQTQGVGYDWTETYSMSGTFSFATAPIAGDIISCEYGIPGPVFVESDDGTDYLYGD